MNTDIHNFPSPFRLPRYADNLRPYDHFATILIEVWVQLMTHPMCGNSSNLMEVILDLVRYGKKVLMIIRPHGENIWFVSSFGYLYTVSVFEASFSRVIITKLSKFKASLLQSYMFPRVLGLRPRFYRTMITLISGFEVSPVQNYDCLGIKIRGLTSTELRLPWYQSSKPHFYTIMIILGVKFEAPLV